LSRTCNRCTLAFTVPKSPPRLTSLFRCPPPPSPHACGLAAGRLPTLAQEVLMNLTISGHHLEVTPALREYVLTKLERVTRHFDQVVDVTVLLTIEKLKEKERRQKAESRCMSRARHLRRAGPRGPLCRHRPADDKLDRQVVRHKDRLQDHHHDRRSASPRARPRPRAAGTALDDALRGRFPFRLMGTPRPGIHLSAIVVVAVPHQPSHPPDPGYFSDAPGAPRLL